jgi:hypothetical protein
MVRAGWGLSGEVAWKAGEKWNLMRLPPAPVAAAPEKEEDMELGP